MPAAATKRASLSYPHEDRRSIVSAVSDVPDVLGQAEEIAGAMEGDAFLQRTSSALLQNDGELEPLDPDNERQTQHQPEAAAAATPTWHKLLALFANSICSITSVLLNRIVFRNKVLPGVSLAWLAQSVNATIYMLTFLCMAISSSKSGKDSSSSQLSLPKLGGRNLGLFTLAAFGFLGMLTFNNLCLTELSVMGYQIARSANLPMMLFASWLILRQRPSTSDFIGVGVLAIGFFIGGYGNAQDDTKTSTMLGIFYGLCGCVCQTLYYILMKKCLPLFNNKEYMMTAVTGTVVSLMLFPCTYYFDGLGPIQSLPQQSWRNLLSVAIAVAATCGVTFTVALSLRLVGPVTLGVSNYVKSTVQSVISVTVMGESTNVFAVSGFVISLAGSAFYTQGRVRARRKQQAAEAARGDGENDKKV